MNNVGPSAGPGDPSTQAPDGAADASNSASSPVTLHATSRARDPLTNKKTEWLDHMLRSLDIVTYCHFSYLYFLDISFIRFFARTVVQINLFAQKPPNFPAPPRNQKRSAVVSIFIVTIICFLFHLFSDPPSADELNGGYLHGGVIIDFVGQEGPISRLRLLFLDLLIFLLQLTMLSIKVYKQDLLENNAPNRTAAAQDIDREERGVSAGDEVAQNDDDEASEFPPRDDDDNGIYSGEVVVANINIVKTVKGQWAAGDAPRTASNSSSTSSTASAEAARARLRTLFQR